MFFGEKELSYSQLRTCRPLPPPTPLLPLDIVRFTCRRDFHCAESNEKSIFRFLFFELWFIKFTIYRRHTLISKYVTDQKKTFKSGQINMKDAQ